MKISMLTNSVQGGIWNHAVHLSSALQRTGQKTDLISKTPPQKNIPHHRARAVRIYSLEYFYHMSGIISNLRRLRPDIIHTHHQSGNLDFFLPKIKRLGKPLVSTIHIAPDNKSRIDRIVGFYFRRIIKPLSSADQMICVSNYMKQKIEKLGLPDVKTIPNGVDTSIFYPDTSARQDLRTPNDEFTLLFVGRLSPEKGITNLLSACKRLDNVRLNIIGSGPLSSLCKLYSARHSNINFLGRVSNDVLRKHYSAANMTVFPSTWQEPFGMVLIESMACGTPVLAHSVGGVPEIVVEGKNGLLVREKTPAALRKAVLYVRDNPFPASASRFCVRYVKGRYSWDAVADETLKTYRRLI